MEITNKTTKGEKMFIAIPKDDSKFVPNYYRLCLITKSKAQAKRILTQSDKDPADYDIVEVKEGTNERPMDDDTYNYIIDAMCMALDLLDDLSNPDFDKEYNKLDIAVDKFYNWYNTKEE